MKTSTPTLAVLVLSALSLLGCSSAPRQSSRADVASVAVLGVTVRDEVTGFNRAAATRELVTLAGEGGRRVVLPPARVSAALGADRWRALNERHARDGTVGDAGLRALAQARLGTRFALIARIEADKETPGTARYGPARDASGRVLPDRTAQHMTSGREMELSVELIDLDGGEPIYRRFLAQPRSHRTHTRYFGSSFSGSVAASLANRMVGGEPRHPPPPSRHETLRALLDEAVRLLPDA